MDSTHFKPNSMMCWQNGDGPGHTFYQYSTNGGASWTDTASEAFPAMSGQDCLRDPDPPTITVAAGATVMYRIAGYLDANPSGTFSWFDKNGTQNGTDYETFVMPGCDKTVTTSTGATFSTAISGVSSGQDLCLENGTYSWGEINPPAGVRIRGLNSGAVIAGGAELVNAGIRLQNLRFELQNSLNNATIWVRGDDAELRDLHIDNNNIGDVQGILVGNAVNQPDGTVIRDTIIHNTRGSQSQCVDNPPMTSGHNKIHAIYWANGTNGDLGRLWMYDFGGYGLHFYSNAGGSAAGTHGEYTVSDQSVCNFGNVFDDISGNATFDQTIVTDPNTGGWWKCVPTPGTTVTLTNARVQDSYGPSCSGSGHVIADTTYVDEANHIYKLPNSGPWNFEPGTK